jgi:tetratricopeptide (TPR) repeat protein
LHRQIERQAEGITHAYLAETALLQENFPTTQTHLSQARQLAEVHRYEKDLIRVARLEGTLALQQGKLDEALPSLQEALTRARTIQLVPEELPCLIALAELSRQQGDMVKARAYLDEVWEWAERRPYPLFHADALNVLAQIERDEGHTQAAIEAAALAYQKAWCDGPPYAYHRGLETAKAHLTALGAPFPDMPPFDPTQHDPMPKVDWSFLDKYKDAE